MENKKPKIVVKNISSKNQIHLPVEAAVALGQPHEKIGVYIKTYHDRKDDKLAFTVDTHDINSIEELDSLKINNLDVEEYEQNDGWASGKITLTSVDNGRYETKFSQADQAVLVMHWLDDGITGRSWVSVYPRQEFEDTHPLKETEESGRTAIQTGFKDLRS